MTEPTAITVEPLGELDAHTRKLTVDPRDITPDASFIAERFRNDENVNLVDLERWLDKPRRQRGNVVVHDWSDFAQLVNRLRDAHHSALYANVDAGTVTAVFDDHAAEGVAGWRSHTAELKLQADPDWTRWLAFNGKLLSQTDFATVLEDLAHTVVSPDAATLLEVATSFRATKKADFDSTVNVQNGDVQLSYSEVTNAAAGAKKSGSVEVPRTFVIRIAPWRGVDPVDVTARFRYHVDNGHLSLGFALLRPDRAKDDAFALILQQLREEIDEDVPLFKGIAPAAVVPAQ